MEESKKQVPARHTEQDERHNTDTETRRHNVASTWHAPRRAVIPCTSNVFLLELIDTWFRLCTFLTKKNPNYLLLFQIETVFSKISKMLRRRKLLLMCMCT